MKSQVTQIKKQIVLLLVLWFSLSIGYSQIIIPFQSQGKLVPESRFLSGRKFPILHGNQTFDFKDKSVRVELFDDRVDLQLKKINCSKISLDNSSEFFSPQMIFKLEAYIDSLFSNANLIIDSNSNKKILIQLQAIDSKLFGHTIFKAHGLCQLKISLDSFEKIYCCDIVDGDKNSPFASSAIATRKRASRVMVSASIRECIEQFLFDLKENDL